MNLEKYSLMNGLPKGTVIFSRAKFLAREITLGFWTRVKTQIR